MAYQNHLFSVVSASSYIDKVPAAKHSRTSVTPGYNCSVAVHGNSADYGADRVVIQMKYMGYFFAAISLILLCPFVLLALFILWPSCLIVWMDKDYGDNLSNFGRNMLFTLLIIVQAFLLWQSTNLLLEVSTVYMRYMIGG